ncbi:MAG: LicD family protein [Hyphomicrobiales bacterium]|nr:LicD family protein [Hyphomicrobiales bacterium]MCP4998879.1 LicD family protein [Hyphomicrobiales bacterium]
MVDRKAENVQAEIERLFPDRREEGDTTLRQCQLVMVRMLKIFDHICARESISYWLTAGTLIGALRHGGMIPWDCDIDVGMTAEDLQAFTQCTDQLPSDIFFQSMQTDPYHVTALCKLRDRHSNYYESQQQNPHSKSHNGLQVDLICYHQNDRGKLVNPFRMTDYDRSEIFPLTRIAFEGSLLLAPTNPDRYIRRRYGDYMKLPPPDERLPHEGAADPFQPCGHPESRQYKSPGARSPNSV